MARQGAALGHERMLRRGRQLAERRGSRTRRRPCPKLLKRLRAQQVRCRYPCRCGALGGRCSVTTTTATTTTTGRSRGGTLRICLRCGTNPLHDELEQPLDGTFDDSDAERGRECAFREAADRGVELGSTQKYHVVAAQPTNDSRHTARQGEAAEDLEAVELQAQRRLTCSPPPHAEAGWTNPEAPPSTSAVGTLAGGRSAGHRVTHPTAVSACLAGQTAS